jgi:hypothetical protein
MYRMTARKSIPLNSAAPLFVCDFAAPGASGAVTIDGKIVKTFQNEQHLRIYALRLEKPAAPTFMVGNDDFKYCQP